VEVRFHPEVETEFRALPEREQAAIRNEDVKLRHHGSRLSFPHSSAVRGSRLRELRPRAGRSRWRALYARVGKEMVILAVVPEALVDRRGFARGVRAAEARFRAFEDG